MTPFAPVMKRCWRKRESKMKFSQHLHQFQNQNRKRMEINKMNLIKEIRQFLTIRLKIMTMNKNKKRKLSMNSQLNQNLKTIKTRTKKPRSHSQIN